MPESGGRPRVRSDLAYRCRAESEQGSQWRQVRPPRARLWLRHKLPSPDEIRATRESLASQLRDHLQSGFEAFSTSQYERSKSPTPGKFRGTRACGPRMWAGDGSTLVISKHKPSQTLISLHLKTLYQPNNLKMV